MMRCQTPVSVILCWVVFSWSDHAANKSMHVRCTCRNACHVEVQLFIVGMILRTHIVLCYLEDSGTGCSGHFSLVLVETLSGIVCDMFFAGCPWYWPWASWLGVLGLGLEGKSLLPNGILLHAKFTLRPSLAFSYIGSVTARHSSSGPPPNFSACYKEWNYGTYTESATPIFGWAAITLCIGPHCSFDLKLWFCRRIITSDQSNLTKRPRRTAHKRFICVRRMAPMYTPSNDLLPWTHPSSYPKWHPHWFSLFAQLTAEGPYIFLWTAPFPSKLLLSIVDLGPTWVHIPNDMSIGSAVFAGLTMMTDRPRYSVCNNRPPVSNAAMRPDTADYVWMCFISFYQSIKHVLIFYSIFHVLKWCYWLCCLPAA